jgi:hypothetical protein
VSIPNIVEDIPMPLILLSDKWFHGHYHLH